MEAGQKRDRPRSWLRFLVHVDEVSVPEVVERRTQRSMAAFITWVVGGLVVLGVIVWQILAVYQPSERIAPVPRHRAALAQPTTR